MRRAKILATLGPASNTKKVIEAMLDVGLNAVRINMSHGTQDEHAALIKLARETAEKMNKPLAVLVDLSGPKIRTRSLKDGVAVFLETGAQFVITSRDIDGTAQEVATNFKELPKLIEPETKILLDDGAIELVVESVSKTDVVTRVVNGGILGERKGINLPNTNLPIPSLTE